MVPVPPKIPIKLIASLPNYFRGKAAKQNGHLFPVDRVARD
jgi:hypothetical protein